MVNADDPAALALARRRDARGAFALRARARGDGFSVDDGWIVERRGRTRRRRSCRSTRFTLPGRHMLSDVVAAAAVSRDRRRDAGRDDGGGRRVSAASSTRWSSSARSTACGSSTTRRPPTSSRRCGRSRASTRGLVRDHRRPLQGRRLRRAARAAACAQAERSSRSAKRAPLVERGARRRRAGARRGDRWRRRCAQAFALAQPGGVGAAGAGVRELRHVPRLRGARPAVQGGGAAARRGATSRDVSSEQSSVSLRRWELAAGNAGCPGL